MTAVALETAEESMLPDRRRTTVVDLTYRCNSPCRYCRWGNPLTPGREHLALDRILLPSATLRSLGTERVVFSGGEPLLHPLLGSVLDYFRTLVPERVIITNGLLLDGRKLRMVESHGVTGFAFSLDTVSPERYFATRGWREPQLRRVLANLAAAAHHGRGANLEIGINAVVTRANACWEHIKDLLSFATELDLSCVKFQPLFDDGYLGQHAPWLALDQRSAAELDRIAEEVRTWQGVPTNVSEFWKDLAILARGGRLAGGGCGLGEHTALVAQGRISRCYWVPRADIGQVGSAVSKAGAAEATRRLEEAKSRCRVDARCFCLQGMEHVWPKLPAPDEDV